MFSPEEQQIGICLLKLNLEEIENDLMRQRSAMPWLDTENELKYRETMNTLKRVRSLNMEIEQLKQESVQLTAKRMQLKQQCEDYSRELERAHRNRNELENLSKQEEHEIEQEIRNYEESLREIADRFRKMKIAHNRNEMNVKIESVNKINTELENEGKMLHSKVIELQRELDQMQFAVPENIIDIIGKTELDEKLKSLSIEYDDLNEKRNKLLDPTMQY